MDAENRLKTLCTRENVTKFARFIWKADGCPADRDVENWLEAETLLQGRTEPPFARRQKPLVVFLPS